ncbi:hypothetical protein San01_20490 [Streptomyces angustmyceticus]|uniref:Uncharacterized protein n=1 Tax=Streptomyces angustmyceticus TaxID=285578 RepID=A0A5J4LBJ6_9ACTN|nr:hypothetical protein San01_20490 [Streptomyces angustmyceticus]
MSDDLPPTVVRAPVAAAPRAPALGSVRPGGGTGPPDRDPNKIGAIAVCAPAAADILLPMHQSSV